MKSGATFIILISYYIDYIDSVDCEATKIVL